MNPCWTSLCFNFCCCLKRWNKTHQAVFASEENVHGTDDPISKDQSQPETNEGDILKWIICNYQIRSFCFYTLAKKSWTRVKFVFYILLLKLRKRWARDTWRAIVMRMARMSPSRRGFPPALTQIIHLLSFLSGPVLHPQNDKVLIKEKR